MLDRPEGGERAVLVSIDLKNGLDPDNLNEFTELCLSAGATPVVTVTGQRQIPEVRYLIGTGKAAEVQDAVKAYQADVIIVNHALSPSQARNLEQLCQCRVVDRTSLILDIFALRARSFEGKLQVELAQLKHLATRLIRGWTHLERQKGGIGMRGPGETQLETDRRLLNERVKQIQKRLDKVMQTRAQGRQARQRSETPTVALVGYTNAGKSTLFNQLTKAEVYAADQLFATLDPTYRAVKLDDVNSVILVDTVGFISDLPHELVAAFHSTLLETTEADLLLEIIDAASPTRAQNMSEVAHVLKSIDAQDVPRLRVYNKIDLLEQHHANLELDADGLPRSVWLSASSGHGVELLIQAIAAQFAPDQIKKTLILPPQATKLRAKLFALEMIKSEEINEQGEFKLAIHGARRHLERLVATDNDAAQWLAPILPPIAV